MKLKLIPVIIGICLCIFIVLGIKTLNRYVDQHFNFENNLIPADYDLSVESHTIDYKGGTIAGWYINHINPKALIILTHGYTINGYGGKSLMLPHAKYLFDAGYSVFLWDIPGFGESSGDSITLGITEWKSAAKVYEYVRHLQNNLSLSIGFMGISMGATTIINTVGITNKGDFIIAVVPYATLTSLATQILHSTFPELKYVPFFVDIIFKLKFGFDYANYLPQITIENISVPILIMYAENDSIVNPQDAKELYAKAHSPKEVWSIASNHFIYYAYPNEFSQTVLDFLSKYINNE